MNRTLLAVVQGQRVHHMTLELQVKQPSSTFIFIDKTINPLMTGGRIGLLQLQALSDLLGATTLFQPVRKMRFQPSLQLAKLTRTGSENVALLVCEDRFVGR